MESSGLLFLFFLLASADLCKAEKNVNNIFNWSYDNITVYSTLNELMNIIDLLLNQQDAENARSFGCSLDIKNKLAECQGKCTTISCYYQELKKFMSACWSGTKQSCNGEGECHSCGIANIAENRSKVKRSNRGRPFRQRQPKPTRIIGGTETTTKKYPWMVMILRNLFKYEDTTQKIDFLTFECGGSIINNRWVLTAGQCLDPAKIMVVRVLAGGPGLWDVDDNTKDYHVKRQVLHPEYENTRLQPYNNYGLLELTEAIPFDDNNIRPVCLPSDDSKTYAGVIATIIGWGDTINSTGHYQGQNTLMEVDLPIVANADCNGFNKTLGNTKPITDSQLCADPVIISENNYKDACYFDRGGPLMVKEGDRYIQVGILSYGGLCFYRVSNSYLWPTLSTVYSRVSKEIDWIRETTESGTCLG